MKKVPIRKLVMELYERAEQYEWQKSLVSPSDTISLSILQKSFEEELNKVSEKYTQYFNNVERIEIKYLGKIEDTSSQTPYQSNEERPLKEGVTLPIGGELPYAEFNFMLIFHPSEPYESNEKFAIKIRELRRKYLHLFREWEAEVVTSKKGKPIIEYVTEDGFRVSPCGIATTTMLLDSKKKKRKFEELAKVLFNIE